MGSRPLSPEAAARKRAGHARWKAANPDYYVNRQRRKRADAATWLNRLKSKPCADCGGSFHWSAMDFDHVRDEKIANVSTLIRQSINIDGPSNAVLEEIAKCDLICANCHRVRTYNRLHGLPCHTTDEGD